jgi:mono/diheme cytochrome c family protein
LKRSNLFLGWCLVAAAAPALAGNWNVPTNARNLQNPVPRIPARAAQAAQVYADNCVACHGVEAAGDGTHARVDYDLRSIVGSLTDGELYWKITHGVGRMPSYAGALNDTQRWLVINHLRVLAERRGVEPPAP